MLKHFIVILISVTLLSSCQNHSNNEVACTSDAPNIVDTTSPNSETTTTASELIDTPIITTEVYSNFILEYENSEIRILSPQTREFLGIVTNSHYYGTGGGRAFGRTISYFEQATGIKIHSVTLNDWSKSPDFSSENTPALSSSILNYYTLENDSNYISVDGVIFSKDMKTLVAFPPGRGGAYIIPEGVEKVNNDAFGCTAIESLYIPESLKKLGDALLDARALETIIFQDTVSQIEMNSIGLYHFYFSNRPFNLFKYITAVSNGEDSEMLNKHFSIATLVNPSNTNKNSYSEKDGVLTITEGVKSLFELDIDSLSEKEFEKVIIPASMYSVSGAYLINTKFFEVSQNNEYLQSIDGVIYSKNIPDTLALIAYPRAREGEYKVNENTKYIAASAFRNSNIEVLHLDWPWNIVPHAFDGCNKLKKISVSKAQFQYLYVDIASPENFIYEVRDGSSNLSDAQKYLVFIILPDGSHYAVKPTFTTATNTTVPATTAAEDTTVPAEKDPLLEALTARWKKNYNTEPEKTYSNSGVAIVSRYYSSARNHLCMMAYSASDGSVVYIDAIRISDGWMQDASPAIYDRISYFEEAFNTTVTKYTFTDQKLLMSVKNNVPNNVESFDINDPAGKYIVKIIDGVVFNEKVTELILFPPGRTGSYTVPDGVTKISDGAFNHSKLSEVIIPASVTEVGTAFDKAPNIKIVREESK